MAFDCPKCGAVGKGFLSFNLVQPCDTCMGIRPSVKRTIDYYYKDSKVTGYTRYGNVATITTEGPSQSWKVFYELIGVVLVCEHAIGRFIDHQGCEFRTTSYTLSQLEEILPPERL